MVSLVASKIDLRVSDGATHWGVMFLMRLVLMNVDV